MTGKRYQLRDNWGLGGLGWAERSYWLRHSRDRAGRYLRKLFGNRLGVEYRDSPDEAWRPFEVAK